MPENEGQFADIPQALTPRTDTVTIAEYAEAMKLLESFVQAEVTVTNLEELTRAIRGVGDALRAVTITNGTFTQGWVKYNEVGSFGGGSDTEYHIYRPGLEGGYILSLGLIYPFNNSLPYVIVTHQHQDSIFMGFNDSYDVSFPVTKPINVVGDKYALTRISAYRRTGEGIEEGRYTPLEKPQDPQTQQGYLRIAQRAVRDVLALKLPPPTPV